jgi:acyl phosphate:glycerol-3-phosphate acyltransferase
MITLYVIVAVVAYLLGSIPFGYLLVKVFRGEDIRLTGSGNIGATNVARSGAKGLGAVTLLLDTLKGALAVGLAWLLATSPYNPCDDPVTHLAIPCVPALHLMATAALFAVAGHIFPVWLKFKGGKGVATALGVFVLLFPKAIPVSLAIFILVVALTRYVSLGSILATISFPVAAWFLYHPDWISLLPVVIVGALIIGKHHANIRRLMAGTENRLGGKKTSAMERQT